MRSVVFTMAGALAGSLGLLVLTPTAPVAAYPLNRCAPTENGYPVLDRINVTQTVDARRGPARFRVAAKAHDTGGPGPTSGLRDVRMTLSGLAYVKLHYVGNHWWVAWVTAPRWTTSGTRVIQSVELEDRADFPYRYYDDDQDVFTPDVTYHPGGERRWSQVVGDRTFTVLSRPDITAPRITDVDFTPQSVDTRGGPVKVTITARATDNLSGVTRGEVDFRGPEVPYYRPPTTVTLRPVPDTDGLLRGEWTVPTDIGTGDWKMVSVAAYDRAGNAGRVDPFDYDADWPTVLHVVSDPEPTRGEPTITSVTADKAQVDVHDGDQTVTYQLHAVNPDEPLPEGNAEVGLNVGQPERSWIDFDTPKLVSGNQHDGSWEITATVDSCIALSGTITPSVTPSGATAPPLDILAGDNTDPTFTAKWSAHSQRRFFVDFSEDVNGISTTSMRVLRRDGLDYTRMPGTWTCGPEPTPGTNVPPYTVDCDTGPVRRAAYTLRKPVDKPAWLLRINPNHVLDVTDRAGNPIHREQTIAKR